MTLCIKVFKKYGEIVRRLLLEYGLLDKSYKISSTNDHLLIPISDRVRCKNILDMCRIPFEVVQCNPPPRKTREGIRDHIPAHDLVNRIVIVREKVVNEYGGSRIIEIIRKLYPWIEAIYVKYGTETDYRVSKLKLLWGKETRYVIHKEYGLKFYIDLHRVYFNPRLSTEHRLLAEMVKDNEIVFDLFSGFGGFPIHIASLRRTIIYANDINPYAISCLLKSIILNKRRLKGVIHASIMDARLIPKYYRSSIADRIIANLPHRSLDFLDTYNYLAHRGTILHLYTIGNTVDDVVERVRGRMGSKWLIRGYRKVLDHSPYTYIFRIDLQRL